ATGRGAGEGRLVRGLGLEEAPAGLLVEGEGGAGPVAETTRLTGIEGRLLDRLVVVAGQVGVGQQGNAAVGGCRRAQQENGRNKTESRTGPVPHDVSLKPWPPGRGHFSASFGAKVRQQRPIYGGQ